MELFESGSVNTNRCQDLAFTDAKDLTNASCLEFDNMTFVPPGGGFSTPFVYTHIFVIFIVCYVIVFACCFFGNILVLFVILRNIRMRSRTNFFLANLALADLCVGLFCVFPNMSTFLSPTWILGRVMCKVYYFVHQMSYTASITLLTVISMERYLAIMHPLKAQRIITKRKLKVALVVIWLLSAAYNVPQLIMFDTVYFPMADVTYCYTTVQVVDMRAYHTANFVVWYVMPLLLMSFVYTRISIILWRTSVKGHMTSAADVSMDSSPSITLQNMAYSPLPLRISFKKNCNECTGLKEGINTMNLKEKSASRQNGTLRCLELRGRRKKIKLSKDLSHEFNLENVSGELESETRFDHIEDSYTTVSEVERSVVSGHPSSRMRVALVIGRKNKNSGRNCSGHPVESSTYVSKVVKPDLKRRGSGRRREKVRHSALHARRKVIRLLVAVVISFAVCVLPYHVLILMKDWATSSTATSIFSLFPPVSYLILYLNSGLNPMLYALFSDNFRRSLAESFKCKKRNG